MSMNNYAERVSSCDVKPSWLIRANIAASRGGGIYAAIGALRDELSTAEMTAVVFRMMALAAMASKGIKGFTRPSGASGWVLINEAMIEAAARCPIDLNKNPPEFDWIIFPILALQYAEVEGVA